MMILVAAIGLLAVIPDLIVTRVTGVARGTRAGLASAWFTVAFAVLAWAIRRLQARHVL